MSCRNDEAPARSQGRSTGVECRSGRLSLERPGAWVPGVRPSRSRTGASREALNNRRIRVIWVAGVLLGFGIFATVRWFFGYQDGEEGVAWWFLAAVLSIGAGIPMAAYA